MTGRQEEVLCGDRNIPHFDMDGHTRLNKCILAHLELTRHQRPGSVYWVGQKVRSGFGTLLQATQMNVLANPIINGNLFLTVLEAGCLRSE